MVARIALAFLIIAIPLFVGACAGRSQTAQQPEAHTPIWRSQLRERALLLLAEAARDENALVRANALEGLAPVPMRARPFVFDALTDRNLGVRYAGAMLAGRLALPDAAPLLRDLQSDADASVRAASIYALSALRQPVDPGPLATMLLDGDVRTRAQAAFILGEMGNRSAVPLLREALMRPAPNARLSDVRL
ncbi:MAG: HEAT repeat domain-containing protein, partial [Phycisphaerales bacterium]